MFNLFASDPFNEALLEMDGLQLASLIVKVEGDENGIVHYGDQPGDGADYYEIADSDESGLREHIIRNRDRYEPHVVRAAEPVASQPVNIVDAAKYKGREVPLGKPMKGDVKKFKVYVKDPKTGNIKKVNFGDPNMEIKRDDPKRRKNFRSRHNCANPGPRTKARYWSCRMWSKKPVSKIVSSKDGE